MFAPAHIDCGFSRSLSQHGLPPSRARLFFTLFFVHFSSSLFTLVCYISIMQPLPASEEERIRPTLPSVITCHPWLTVEAHGDGSNPPSPHMEWR